MILRGRYINRIRPFIHTDLIKVLTGIRRSGKSVMLKLIQQELLQQGVSERQILAINFENLENMALCEPIALHNHIMDYAKNVKGKLYLFLDEIQEAADWERVISSLRVSIDVDIYITGSNAKLLSGELATYLVGRYVQFTIYPFSYREFLAANKAENDSKSFRQYMVQGGMPFLTNLAYQQEPSRQYLREIYNSVMLKDIIQRNKLRDVDLLERIILYSFSSIGNTFSATSIAKYLKNENRKASNDTVLSYLKACTAAYLLNKVPRMDLQGKKLLSINEKYYAADIGIREAVYGNNMRDVNQILENIVCLDLLSRGYNVSIGKLGDYEIDFIAEKNSKIMYIQVTYLLASEDTIEREFGVYRHIRDNFPKYVLSMDEFDFSRDGIQHENIRDFLLREED